MRIKDDVSRTDRPFWKRILINTSKLTEGTGYIDVEG